MKKTGIAKQIVTRCPSCRSETVYRGPGENPHFPFCTERCKLLDLDRWLKGEYVIESGVDDADEESDVE